MNNLSRVDKSRELIRKALDCALGSYIEQEGKKEDQWRDQNLGQLFAHLSHELEECKGNIKHNEMGYLLHNAMDVMELGAMIFCKAQEIIEGKLEKEN